MKTSYHPLSKTLHWAMALAIFGLLALGFVMSDMPLSPEKLQYFSWHKWAGVSVFFLVWIRLIWRVITPPPAYPNSISRPLQILAHGGHFLLYALMLVIPLSGWLMSSAKGVQTVWFGVWPLPDLLSRDKELGKLLEWIHGSLNWVLIALIVGHVGAALKHHFIDRDDILTRMLPHKNSPGNDHA
jgi:cytochrome b561